jgi:hypothetical protein
MAVSLAPSQEGMAWPSPPQVGAAPDRARVPLVFRRYAGSLQLRLRTFDELLALVDVPEALWVATACPTTGLSCDPAFLSQLDTEASGRVRARMFLRAIAWTGQMLRERSGCVPGSATLTLAHLSSEATPLRAAAESVLDACGSSNRDQVSLEQVRQVREERFPSPPSPAAPSAPDLLAPPPPAPELPADPYGSFGTPSAPLAPLALTPPAPVSEEQQRLMELERLILFQRWLLSFANNFVSMPDLYARDRPALFEQGTLIMAGREFSLAVHVTDRATHAALAGESSMFILYCAITGGQPTRSFEVAVPVTSGTSRGLYVGKRGIFRDTEGREYDAQVVHLIQQPVSLYEAAVTPLRRIVRFVSSRVESWSSSADTRLEEQLMASTRQRGPPTSQPGLMLPHLEAPPVDRTSPSAMQGTVGLVVGASVAVAALGSALAFIINQLRSVTPLQILFSVGVILVLAMIPTLILAFIRIFHRDLAVVLEGAGWAMNDRLRLTRRLGKLFTRRPRRPRGSRIDTRDKVAELLVQLKAKEEGRSRFLLKRLAALLLLITVALLLWSYRLELGAWVTHALSAAPPSGAGPAP